MSLPNWIGRWWLPLGIVSVAAIALSALLLDKFVNSDSERYVFPLLAGATLLATWGSHLHKNSTPTEALSPGWNFYLFTMGCIFVAYPFSGALEAFGTAPLLIAGALVDGLVYLIVQHGLNLPGLTAAVGLLIFGWLWELAGQPDPVVLQVDLPVVEDAQFTSEGVTNALSSGIKDFPPNSELIFEQRPTEPAQRDNSQIFPDIPAVLDFSKQRGRRPLLGWQKDIFNDLAHYIGKAQFGGINVEPLYEALRHIRHRPTLDAQMLLGEDGSLTLALRRSDFPPACFSDRLPEQLLEYAGTGLTGHGERALRDLQGVVERDIEDAHKLEKSGATECSPSWMRETLDRLGVSGVPSLAEDRISNVTVASLTQSRPNEQLTQLIDRAVLEGMEKISPSVLGYYYDSMGRPESALSHYREALPYEIQAAGRARGVSAEPARRRVAYLIMNIADLEARPQKTEGEEWTKSTLAAFHKSERHYAAAVKLIPEDQLAHASEGYFLFSNAFALHRDGLLGDKETDKTYGMAQNDFQAVVSFTQVGLEAQFGNDAARRLRAFSLKNLAAVLTTRAELSIRSNTKRGPMLDQAEQRLKEAERLVETNHVDDLDSRNRGNPDLEVTMLRGRIGLLRNKCEDSLNNFSTAYPLSTLRASRLYVDLEVDGYRVALEKCGSSEDRDLLSMLHWLSDLSLAVDHSIRGRVEQAKKDMDAALNLALLGGTEQAAGTFNRLAKLSSWAHGIVLWQRSCFSEQYLEEDTRDPDEAERISMLHDSSEDLDRGADRANPSWSASLALRESLLSSSTASEPEKLANAISVGEDALRERPYDQGLRLGLGKLQLRLGDLASAERTFRDAAILGPSDPEVHYLLGLTLIERDKEAKDGRIERGRDEWQYARALDPERWQYLDDPLPGCEPTLGRPVAIRPASSQVKGAKRTQQIRAHAARSGRLIRWIITDPSPARLRESAASDKRAR